MKKLIALVLAAMLVLSLAACNNTTAPESTPAPEGTQDTTTPDVTTPDNTTVDTTPVDPTETMGEEDPIEYEDLNACAGVLENAWVLYAEEEKFPVRGGYPEAMYMAGPYNYTAETMEYLTYDLLIPAEQVANVAEAGSMIHMMNANTFTSGVVKLTEGTDLKAFAQTMKDTIASNQWMCGFPERMYIAAIDGQYLLISYGVNDAMTPFVTHVTEAYATAEVLFDAPIA